VPASQGQYVFLLRWVLAPGSGVNCGVVAMNPHFVGLELLPLRLLRWLRLCPKGILSVHGVDIGEAVKSSG